MNYVDRTTAATAGNAAGAVAPDTTQRQLKAPNSSDAERPAQSDMPDYWVQVS